MSDGEKEARLTVQSTPPNECKYEKRSYWPTVFGEARECPGVWVRTERWFNRSTASQVASDARNSHTREPDRMRIKGALSGEKWETRWGNDPSDPNLEHFYVWLRLVRVAGAPSIESVHSG